MWRRYMILELKKMHCQKKRCSLVTLSSSTKHLARSQSWVVPLPVQEITTLWVQMYVHELLPMTSYEAVFRQNSCNAQKTKYKSAKKSCTPSPCAKSTSSTAEHKASSHSFPATPAEPNPNPENNTKVAEWCKKGKAEIIHEVHPCPFARFSR